MISLLHPRSIEGFTARLAMLALATLVAVAGLASTASAQGAQPSWDDYLDFAYVYSSSDADALGGRLDQYAGEIGLPLDAWVKRTLEDREA